MRISDWSSDVCSSDLLRLAHHLHDLGERAFIGTACHLDFDRAATVDRTGENPALRVQCIRLCPRRGGIGDRHLVDRDAARKGVGQGTSVSVRVVLGGRRSLKKKTYHNIYSITY